MSAASYYVGTITCVNVVWRSTVAGYSASVDAVNVCDHLYGEGI